MGKERLYHWESLIFCVLGGVAAVAFAVDPSAAWYQKGLAVLCAVGVFIYFFTQPLCCTLDAHGVCLTYPLLLREFASWEELQQIRVESRTYSRRGTKSVGRRILFRGLKRSRNLFFLKGAFPYTKKGMERIEAYAKEHGVKVTHKHL